MSSEVLAPRRRVCRCSAAELRPAPRRARRASLGARGAPALARRTRSSPSTGCPAPAVERVPGVSLLEKLGASPRRRRPGGTGDEPRCVAMRGSRRPRRSCPTLQDDMRRPDRRGRCRSRTSCGHRAGRCSMRPDGDRLCHGDLHPGNMLATASELGGDRLGRRQPRRPAGRRGAHGRPACASGSRRRVRPARSPARRIGGAGPGGVRGALPQALATSMDEPGGAAAALVSSRPKGSRRRPSAADARAGVPSLGSRIDVPLLSPRSTDEYAPVPPGPRQQRALHRTVDLADRHAPRLDLTTPEYLRDRVGTAAALRALDAEHGGGFFDIPAEAEVDPAAADECFAALGPVVDVQTHLVRPSRHTTASAAALMGFLRMVEPERWRDPIDPDHLSAPAWASCVFAGSETSVALLTSPPGLEGDAVIDNGDIAAAREVVDRYAGSGRVLTHTIVHPNAGPDELDRMATWSAQLRPAGWKVYTLWDPPGGPTGGWYLDDDLGAAFLDRVREVRPAHRLRPQGPRRPDPVAGPGGGVTAGHRPGGRRLPRHRLRRVPLRLRHRRPPRRKAPTTPTPSAASAGSSPASPTPASGRAPTCGPSSGPPGRWCCADRSRPPTCSASSSSPSARTASCGAPTPSGTARPNPSSTPSAPSRSPTASRRPTATRPSRRR